MNESLLALALAAAPAPNLPPAAPVGELIAHGALMSALDGYGDESAALKAGLTAAGDEQAFFAARLRPGLPPPRPEQAGLLAALARRLPALDPATVFFIPEGHPLYDSERYAYALSLYDRAGRATPAVFIMDAGTPDWQTLSSLVHEHMHQKQVPLPEMVRRLEGATGVPRRFLWKAALRLQEGAAQAATKQRLAVLLMDRADPFAGTARAWLAAAAQAKRAEDPDAEWPASGGGDEDLLAWLEELAVTRHAYAGEVDSARTFPAVRSSGAPEVAVAMAGDMRPLVEAWSPSKRRALALVAAHARAHPDYPFPASRRLMEGVAMLVDPADPLDEAYAASLAAEQERLLAELGGGRGATGLSDRLRR